MKNVRRFSKILITFLLLLLLLNSNCFAISLSSNTYKDYMYTNSYKNPSYTPRPSSYSYEELTYYYDCYEDLLKINTKIVNKACTDTDITVLNKYQTELNTRKKDYTKYKDNPNRSITDKNELDTISGVLSALVTDITNLKKEYDKSKQDPEENPEDNKTYIEILEGYKNYGINTHQKRIYDIYMKYQNYAQKEKLEKTEVNDIAKDVLQLEEIVGNNQITETNAVEWLMEKMRELVKNENVVTTAYYQIPQKYRDMYNNKEYLTMGIEDLKTTGTELKRILKEEYLKQEDRDFVTKLLTKVNDMVNKIQYESDIDNTGNSVIEQGKEYINGAEQKIDSQKIAKAVVAIGQIFLVIAVLFFSVILLILGIKYILASTEERGKLKTQLIGFMIAAIVTFGAYTIWKIVYPLMESLF